MRAVVNTEYGGPDVLQILDVERPIPADDEVLVEVHATTVNRTDCGFRAPWPWFVRLFAGLRRPRRTILGSEFAGVVVEAGPAVTRFAVGDEVFGVNSDRFGAHAEYLCVGERSPHIGAHVTAVCNTANVEVVRGLGADEVIDYTVEDFAANGQTYDLVFDAVGKKSFGECKGSLDDGGSYVSTDLGPYSQNVPLMLWTRFIGPKKAMMPLPQYTKDKVLRMKELLETGAYRAVIDRIYPLEDAADATRYVETEQKTGNVLTVTSPR